MPSSNISNKKIRKVSLKEAYDATRDIEYWLTKTPLERLAAVTAIVMQSVGENQRMDKTVVVKRKLKS